MRRLEVACLAVAAAAAGFGTTVALAKATAPQSRISKLESRIRAHEIGYRLARKDFAALQRARIRFTPRAGLQGDKGPLGATGPAGDAGPQGPRWASRAWALVAWDGAPDPVRVVHGSAGASVTQPTPTVNAYCVAFPGVSSADLPAAVTVTGNPLASAQISGGLNAALGDGSAQVVGGDPVPACQTGQYQVLVTTDAGFLSGSGAFSIAVP